MSNPNRTAILLIGYQNDYFSPDGAMHAVIEENARENDVLANTRRLLDAHRDRDTLIINLPIYFSPDYEELGNPTGVLAAIKAAGAFRRDTEGGRTIQEIVDFDDRIQHLSGKTSFNAFMGTDLAEVLRKEGVDHVIVAGVITSLCIDSSARAAVENGFAVTILSDASAGRDQTEHSFYCESIFPLYAEVKSTEELLAHGLDPEHAS
ncbi:MAG: isochorismatase family cysteine hydrolase [Planctomycetota bacterium]|jgi:nicotinamidase-related amidase